MKNKLPIIFFCFVFLFSCFSCSTTPTSDIVTNKADGKLEYIIENSVGTGLSINENTNYANTFNEQTSFFSNNGVVAFNVDATVQIADTDVWPVLIVTPKLWTPDDIEHMTRVFVGNNTVYEHTQAQSKGEIMNTILEIKKKLSDRDALLDYYGDEDLVEYVIMQLEKELTAAERDYETAPDKIERIVSDFEFHDDTYWYTEYSTLQGVEGVNTVKATTEVDGIPYFIWATRQTNGTYRYIDYSIWAYSRFPEGSTDGYIYYQTTPFTQEEIDTALQTVISTLEQINITDWKYVQHHEKSLTEDGVTYYYLTFDIIPIYNGIDGMLSSFGTGRYLDSNGEYISDYYDEAILIKYSNGRIMSYNHLSPLTIKNVVNENVSLISYENALNKIYSQLEYTLTAGRMLIEPYNSSDYSISAATVNITNIELCLVRTPIKDNLDDFYLLPCWIVRGSYSIDEIIGPEGKICPNIVIESDSPILCINGVDGSVVFSI